VDKHLFLVSRTQLFAQPKGDNTETDGMAKFCKSPMNSFGILEVIS